MAIRLGPLPLMARNRHGGAVAACPLSRDKRTWPGRGSTSEKVDQAVSDHAEGTIVANPTDKMGDCRYAVELFGHRTIQTASDGSLIAHVNIAV